MPKKPSIEKVIKKLNELDEKLDKLNITYFAYFGTILDALESRGILDKSSFRKLLKAHKKQYAKIKREAEFIRMMGQFKKKKK